MIHRRPDAEGEHGRAWAIRMADEDRERRPQVVSGWVVRSECQHPSLRYWLVQVVDLAKVDGGSFRQFAGADHEITILTADPSQPTPDPDRADEPYYVLPRPNMVHQLGGLDDVQAKRLCAAVAAMIVHGGESVDPGNAEGWKRSVMGLARELALGAPARGSA